MKDMIIYVADINALTTYMLSNYPQVIGEDGSWMQMAIGPVIRQGDERLVYRRLTEDECTMLDGATGVEILSAAEYVDGTTCGLVYEQLFADSDAMVIYDSIYPRTPVEIVTGDVAYTLTSEEKVEATVTYHMGEDLITRTLEIDGSAEVGSTSNILVTATPETVMVSEPVASTITYTPPDKFGNL